MSNDPWADDDPFDGADEDFDTPQSTFLSFNDEALENRLVILDVLEIKTLRGTDGDYECAVTNVVFPDGEPIPGFVNAIPGVYERMHISATGVFDQIKHLAGQRKPFLCRPDVVLNKRKQRVAGVRKNEVTDADKAIAKPAWRAYKAGELTR